MPVKGLIPYSGKFSRGANFRAFRAHADFTKIRTVKFLTREFLELTWSIIIRADAKIKTARKTLTAFGNFRKICTCENFPLYAGFHIRGAGGGICSP